MVIWGDVGLEGGDVARESPASKAARALIPREKKVRLVSLFQSLSGVKQDDVVMKGLFFGKYPPGKAKVVQCVVVLAFILT